MLGVVFWGGLNVWNAILIGELFGLIQDSFPKSRPRFVSASKPWYLFSNLISALADTWCRYVGLLIFFIGFCQLWLSENRVGDATKNKRNKRFLAFDNSPKRLHPIHQIYPTRRSWGWYNPLGVPQIEKNQIRLNHFPPREYHSWKISTFQK